MSVEVRTKISMDDARRGYADSDRSLERVSIPKTRQVLRIAAEQLLLTNPNLEDSKPVQSLDALVFTINSLEDRTGISPLELTKVESRLIKDRVLAALDVIRNVRNQEKKTKLKRMYGVALSAVSDTCASLNVKFSSDNASRYPDSGLIAGLAPFLTQKVKELSSIQC